MPLQENRQRSKKGESSTSASVEASFKVYLSLFRNQGQKSGLDQLDALLSEAASEVSYSVTEFDGIYEISREDQSHLLPLVTELVQLVQAHDGERCTISQVVAHGGSGTGKTTCKNFILKGLVETFAGANSDHPDRRRLALSGFEIKDLNDRVFDLCSKTNSVRPISRQVRGEYDKNLRIDGLEEVHIKDLRMYAMESKRMAARATVEETKNNKSSTRHHTITQLSISRTTRDGLKPFVLRFIDLCGAENSQQDLMFVKGEERARKTQSSAKINISLDALRLVPHHLLNLNERQLRESAKQSLIVKLYLQGVHMGQTSRLICTLRLDERVRSRNTIRFGIDTKNVKRVLKTSTNMDVTPLLVPGGVTLADERREDLVSLTALLSDMRRKYENLESSLVDRDNDIVRRQEVERENLRRIAELELSLGQADEAIDKLRAEADTLQAEKVSPRISPADRDGSITSSAAQTVQQSNETGLAMTNTDIDDDSVHLSVNRKRARDGTDASHSIESRRKRQAVDILSRYVRDG